MAEVTAEAEENHTLVALTPEPSNASEDENTKQVSLQAPQFNSAPPSYGQQTIPPSKSIEQLYGQISMFD